MQSILNASPNTQPLQHLVAISVFTKLTKLNLNKNNPKTVFTTRTNSNHDMELISCS